MTLAGDIRRLQKEVRHLRSRLISEAPSFTDDELVQALRDGTATPAHLHQIYDVVAEDLKAVLFSHARDLSPEDWRYRWEKYALCPMATAFYVLSHRADQELPPRLLEARTLSRPYDPAGWEKRFRNPPNHAAKMRHLSFLVWARTLLIDHALPTPECHAERVVLDDWSDGGSAPVDLERTPTERVVRLLQALDVAYQYNLLHRCPVLPDSISPLRVKIPPIPPLPGKRSKR